MNNYGFIDAALRNMKIQRQIRTARGVGLPFGNWRIGLLIVKQEPDYSAPQVSMLSKIKNKLTMRYGKPGQGQSRKG